MTPHLRTRTVTASTQVSQVEAERALDHYSLLQMHKRIVVTEASLEISFETLG